MMYALILLLGKDKLILGVFSYDECMLEAKQATELLGHIVECVPLF